MGLEFTLNSMRRTALPSLAIAVLGFATHIAAAESFSKPAAVPSPEAARDGEHDFDYGIGAWKEHTWRLKSPLSGSTEWFEMDGTSVAQKALNGRANLVEYEGDGPTGHLSLVSVRIYNPKTREWSVNFATAGVGTLSATPLYGRFHDGRGEFFSQEEINGRTVLVRFTVTSISPTQARSEQAFSADAGKTWETNWINIYTRTTEDEIARLRAARGDSEMDRTHDFDFDAPSKTHLSRLQAPLSGSKRWTEYDGNHTVHKLWNGRADLVDLVADGPAGHIEGMGLRLYNPKSHQWSLNWVSTGSGTFGVATIGEFKNGRGTFYDMELFDGRQILVRNVWSEITPASSKFEQAFSTDGGATWEVNWVATNTHTKPAP